jgi:hypothetical protein
MKRLVMSSAFCLTLTIATLFLFQVGVQARPCYITDVNYFDENCNEQIGQMFIQCDGTNIHWGDTTPSSHWVAFSYCCGNESCTGSDDCGGEDDYISCTVSSGCPGTCCGNSGGFSWIGPC